MTSAKEEIVNFKGGSCQLCGYNKCLASLHFHHVNPIEKKFKISEKKKIDRELIEELDKCVLVCASCHGEIHSGNVNIEHLAELLLDTKIII